MFFIAVFLLSWTVFLFMFYKEKFINIYPTALLAMIMSLSSDTIVHYYPLWQYSDPYTHATPMLIEILDDFGIYPVIAYLYVLFLPGIIKKWFVYTLMWTIGGIIVEYCILIAGFMSYDLGWSLAWSYLANWIIFTVLSIHAVWHAKKNHTQKFFINNALGKANICFEQKIQPIDPSHLLHEVPSYPGVDFYQIANANRIESFLFILEPNSKFRAHSHEGNELHYLVDGSVSVVLNGQEVHLEQGESICFSSTLSHSFKNLGTRSQPE